MILSNLQDNLGYHFKSEALLTQALSHPSYAYEHSTKNDSNQRLEFLGDAILDFIIADILYNRYPNYHEGDLSRLRSRLVCESALCQLAQKIDLESFILMGKGEISASGMLRPGTLADAYEAIIGAIYLDGGIENARQFIVTHHAPYLNDPEGNWLADDAKTRLQEKAQSKHMELSYKVLQQTGPDHAPCFQVGVFLNTECIGKGDGHNKKEAQQSAAAEALKYLENC